MFFIVGAPFALAAVITGFMGISQINNDENQKGKGLAIGGIICGLIAILLSAAFIILWIAGTTLNPQSFR